MSPAQADVKAASERVGNAFRIAREQAGSSDADPVVSGSAVSIPAIKREVQHAVTTDVYGDRMIAADTYPRPQVSSDPPVELPGQEHPAVYDMDADEAEKVRSAGSDAAMARERRAVLMKKKEVLSQGTQERLLRIAENSEQKARDLAKAASAVRTSPMGTDDEPTYSIPMDAEQTENYRTVMKAHGEKMEQTVNDAVPVTALNASELTEAAGVKRVADATVEEVEAATDGELPQNLVEPVDEATKVLLTSFVKGSDVTLLEPLMSQSEYQSVVQQMVDAEPFEYMTIQMADCPLKQVMIAQQQAAENAGKTALKATLSSYWMTKTGSEKKGYRLQFKPTIGAAGNNSKATALSLQQYIDVLKASEGTLFGKSALFLKARAQGAEFDLQDTFPLPAGGIGKAIMPFAAAMRTGLGQASLTSLFDSVTAAMNRMLASQADRPIDKRASDPSRRFAYAGMWPCVEAALINAAMCRRIILALFLSAGSKKFEGFSSFIPAVLSEGDAQIVASLASHLMYVDELKLVVADGAAQSQRIKKRRPALRAVDRFHFDVAKRTSNGNWVPYRADEAAEHQAALESAMDAYIAGDLWNLVTTGIEVVTSLATEAPGRIVEETLSAIGDFKNVMGSMEGFGDVGSALAGYAECTLARASRLVGSEVTEVVSGFVEGLTANGGTADFPQLLTQAIAAGSPKLYAGLEALGTVDSVNDILLMAKPYIGTGTLGTVLTSALAAGNPQGSVNQVSSHNTSELVTSLTGLTPTERAFRLAMEAREDVDSGMPLASVEDNMDRVTFSHGGIMPILGSNNAGNQLGFSAPQNVLLQMIPTAISPSPTSTLNADPAVASAVPARHGSLAPQSHRKRWLEATHRSAGWIGADDEACHTQHHYIPSQLDPDYLATTGSDVIELLPMYRKVTPASVQRDFERALGQIFPGSAARVPEVSYVPNVICHATQCVPAVVNPPTDGSPRGGLTSVNFRTTSPSLFGSTAAAFPYGGHSVAPIYQEGADLRALATIVPQQGQDLWRQSHSVKVPVNGDVENPEQVIANIQLTVMVAKIKNFGLYACPTYDAVQGVRRGVDANEDVTMSVAGRLSPAIYGATGWDALNGKFMFIDPTLAALNGYTLRPTPANIIWHDRNNIITSDSQLSAFSAQFWDNADVGWTPSETFANGQPNTSPPILSPVHESKYLGCDVHLAIYPSARNPITGECRDPRSDMTLTAQNGKLKVTGRIPNQGPLFSKWMPLSQVHKVSGQTARDATEEATVLTGMSAIFSNVQLASYKWPGLNVGEEAVWECVITAAKSPLAAVAAATDLDVVDLVLLPRVTATIFAKDDGETNDVPDPSDPAFSTILAQDENEPPIRPEADAVAHLAPVSAGSASGSAQLLAHVPLQPGEAFSYYQPKADGVWLKYGQAGVTNSYQAPGDLWYDVLLTKFGLAVAKFVPSIGAFAVGGGQRLLTSEMTLAQKGVRMPQGVFSTPLIVSSMSSTTPIATDALVGQLDELVLVANNYAVCEVTDVVDPLAPRMHVIDILNGPLTTSAGVNHTEYHGTRTPWAVSEAVRPTDMKTSNDVAFAVTAAAVGLFQGGYAGEFAVDLWHGQTIRAGGNVYYQNVSEVDNFLTEGVVGAYHSPIGSKENTTGISTELLFKNVAFNSECVGMSQKAVHVLKRFAFQLDGTVPGANQTSPGLITDNNTPTTSAGSLGPFTQFYGTQTTWVADFGVDQGQLLGLVVGAPSLHPTATAVSTFENGDEATHHPASLDMSLEIQVCVSYNTGAVTPILTTDHRLMDVFTVHIENPRKGMVTFIPIRVPTTSGSAGALTLSFAAVSHNFPVHAGGAFGALPCALVRVV